MVKVFPMKSSATSRRITVNIGVHGSLFPFPLCKREGPEMELAVY